MKLCHVFQQLNPSEMMQRLQRVKKEYNSLVQDAEGIKAMQSEMATYFKTQLQTACTAIKALQENAPQAQVSVASRKGLYSILNQCLN